MPSSDLAVFEDQQRRDRGDSVVRGELLIRIHVDLADFASASMVGFMA